MVMLRVGIPVCGKDGPVVLTVTGRKSGKPRSTPITPMEVGGSPLRRRRVSRARTGCATPAPPTEVRCTQGRRSNVSA